MKFRDRAAAGRRLATALTHTSTTSAALSTNAVVLGLPRGGVPVAAPMAAALGAPLDVFVARKIGAPRQPELGIGAVAEGTARAVWTDLATRVGLGPDELEELASVERNEVEHRVTSYRGDRPLVPLKDRHVVVVDDGLATGVTAEAALRAVASHRPSAVTLAVPIGSPEAVARLRGLADDVICLVESAALRSVGAWYDDFGQVTDREVRALLDRHHGFGRAASP